MTVGKSYSLLEKCEDPRRYHCRVLEVLSVLAYDEEAYKVWIYETASEGVILAAHWTTVELSGLEMELL